MSKPKKIKLVIVTKRDEQARLQRLKSLRTMFEMGFAAGANNEQAHFTGKYAQMKTVGAAWEEAKKAI